MAFILVLVMSDNVPNDTGMRVMETLANVMWSPSRTHSEHVQIRLLIDFRRGKDCALLDCTECIMNSAGVVDIVRYYRGGFVHELKMN